MEKSFLNNKVGEIVLEHMRNTSKKGLQVAKDAGMSLNTFSRLTSRLNSRAKQMTDDEAIKILVACDYSLSSAKKQLAKFKIEEALIGFDEPSIKEVINNFV